MPEDHPEGRGARRCARHPEGVRHCRPCTRHTGQGGLFQEYVPAVWRGHPADARQILLDAHAANNVNFQTDYDKRVEKIGAVVDGCSLLLEYLTICTEEGIISAKKAGIWTKKVTDVKYPAMKWLTSERGRAEKLRAEAERKRLTEQAAALKAVLYPEP